MLYLVFNFAKMLVISISFAKFAMSLHWCNLAFDIVFCSYLCYHIFIDVSLSVVDIHWKPNIFTYYLGLHGYAAFYHVAFVHLLMVPLIEVLSARGVWCHGAEKQIILFSDFILAQHGFKFCWHTVCPQPKQSYLNSNGPCKLMIF